MKNIISFLTGFLLLVSTGSMVIACEQNNNNNSNVLNYVWHTDLSVPAYKMDDQQNYTLTSPDLNNQTTDNLIIKDLFSKNFLLSKNNVSENDLMVMPDQGPLVPNQRTNVNIKIKGTPFYYLTYVSLKPTENEIIKKITKKTFTIVKPSPIEGLNNLKNSFLNELLKINVLLNENDILKLNFNHSEFTKTQINKWKQGGESIKVTAIVQNHNSQWVTLTVMLE